MEYKQLIYFIKLCKSDSISEAAERLFISRQALSRAINDLEKNIGKSLFVRSQKGVELTEDGKLLYETFANHVEEYLVKEQKLKNHFLNRGNVVTLCTPPIIMSSDDIHTIYSFEDIYTSVQIKKIEFTEKDCINHIIKNEDSFGLMPYTENKFKGLMLDSIYIKDYPPYVYMSKNSILASKKKISPIDLTGEKILVLDKISENEEYIHLLEEKYNLKYDIFHKSSSSAELSDFVNKNKGVVIFFDFEFSELTYPNIIKIPLQDKGEEVSLRFVFKNKEKLSVTSRKFIDYIVEQYTGNSAI